MARNKVEYLLDKYRYTYVEKGISSKLHVSTTSAVEKFGGIFVVSLMEG